MSLKPTTIKHGLMFGLFILFSFSFSSSAFSGITSLEDAVNRAGKQRMITQRLLKDYAMVGMDLRFGEPKKDLEEKIKFFDQTLTDLEALSVNDDVNQSLVKINGLWKPIKATLSVAPEQNKVASLQKDLELLLKASHENTGLISKASGSKAGEIANISGRQRMLSQRLASLYMLKVWGVDDPEFATKLEKAMVDFTEAHQTLEESPLSTPEIKDKLKKVKRLFIWFEVMGRSKSGKYTPSLISKSADSILVEMDEITKLYVLSN